MWMLLLTTSLGLAQDLPIQSWAWTTQDVELRRWHDADHKVSDVKAGTKVQVVATENGQVRVRSGANFGWIEVSNLTDEKPSE